MSGKKRCTDVRVLRWDDAHYRIRERENVMQEVGSGLGKDNGVEKEVFVTNGESALEVERELLSV